MTDVAAELQKLTEELKKKTESVAKQVEKHVKKLGPGKTDERLRMLRKQLRKKQRLYRHASGKDKPAKEGEAKK